MNTHLCPIPDQLSDLLLPSGRRAVFVKQSEQLCEPGNSEMFLGHVVNGAEILTAVRPATSVAERLTKASGQRRRLVSAVLSVGRKTSTGKQNHIAAFELTEKKLEFV